MNFYFFNTNVSATAAAVYYVIKHNIINTKMMTGALDPC